MKNNKGLTIIEIIIILAIIGATIPPLLVAFSNVVAKGADAKTVMVATNLAEEKMEEILGNSDFDSIISVDITPFIGDFSDYNYQVVVNFVDESAIDTPLPPGSPPTDLKRVQVIITKTGLAGFNITLTSVITNLD